MSSVLIVPTTTVGEAFVHILEFAYLEIYLLILLWSQLRIVACCVIFYSLSYDSESSLEVRMVGRIPHSRVRLPIFGFLHLN